MVAIALVTAGAWLLTGERMAGMDMGPGTDLGSLAFFTSVWVVMMAAMMFPSAWPTLAVYSRLQGDWREQNGSSGAGSTAAFAAGYLLTWTATGLVAYALLDGARSLSVDAFAWDRDGPYLAGGVILAAALYQLTPLKDVCLSRCRNSLMFVLGSWRPGRAGALRMGAEHGAWCVGCCWALMGVLFALGVMSVGWMVFVAALIAIEKLVPWRLWANRGIAVGLLALALAVALVPDRVPALTQPDSPGARHAMEAMGMPGPAPDSAPPPGG
jgi:predicted metal-binding membrane protein